MSGIEFTILIVVARVMFGCMPWSATPFKLNDPATMFNPRTAPAVCGVSVALISGWAMYLSGSIPWLVCLVASYFVGEVIARWCEKHLPRDPLKTPQHAK
ncbi:MAG: hypothetical protein WEB58_22980 [Planctomycetaceae bacterium]